MPGRPALPRQVLSFEDPDLIVPGEVVLDTSFVVAALNSAEHKHAECVAFLARLTDRGSLLVHNRLLEVELAETAFDQDADGHGGRRDRGLGQAGRARGRDYADDQPDDVGRPGPRGGGPDGRLCYRRQ